MFASYFFSSVGLVCFFMRNAIRQDIVLKYIIKKCNNVQTEIFNGLTMMVIYGISSVNVLKLCYCLFLRASCSMKTNMYMYIDIHIF